MELRKSPIYLDESYYKDCKGTIDPFKVSLSRRNESDVCIHPFINGPIDPNKFYSLPNNERLVVVLKEPYTEKLHGVKEIKSVNQSELRNKTPFSIPEDNGDRLYKNIIKTAALLFEGFVSDNLQNHFDAFRNNVCIRQINQYPALSEDKNKESKYSNNAILLKWGTLTRDAIIREILNDSPGFIIFGGTLGQIVEFKNRTDGINEIQKIFGFTNLQKISSKNDKTIVYFNNDIIIVDANHPSSYGGYCPKEIKGLVDKAIELRGSSKRANHD